MTTLTINPPLGLQLVSQGLLAVEQWDHALAENSRDVSETLHWLVENNTLAPEDLLSELAQYSGLPVVSRHPNPS